jgi:hypothetical protein
VVVGNLYFKGVCELPHEADPPLIVDPNRVLASAIARELLEPIPGRRPQVFQRLGAIQQQELAEGRALDVRRQPARALPIEELSRLIVPEAPNHLDL